MELQGEVTDIIYQNEVNSYTIAVIETVEDEIITCVGYLPFINVGDTLKVVGNFVVHKDYGEQFKVETFEKIMPQTLESLERYLSNGVIKGIGPATARKIIETFGEETVSIFKFEPQKLARIKGISKEKALEMAEEFNENWDLWQIVGYLDKFGIGAENSKKIYKALGNNAINEIEENPYLLVDLIRNVDFVKIDKMAMNLGFSYNNDKRIRSGIKYALNKISYNGHTTTLKLNLEKYVMDLLGVSQDEIDNNLIFLKAKGEIIIEQRENREQELEEWVYLYPFYKAELNVAEKIVALNRAKNIKYIDKFEKEIQKMEKVTSVKLSEKQKEAVNAVNENNVCIVTGGPGTGKTTIIKTMIEIYKFHGMKPILCAPTGRAAKRMTETTGEEAKTLHRLLEIGKFEEDGKIETDYDVAPIDADLIIVDEMSMVDIFLMNYLVRAIYQGTKLVLVGDVDQLPSVGPGNVLKDLIRSEKVCTIVLDKIFRQAAESKIILNAHRVNEGKSFLSKVEEGEEKHKEDFFYIKETNQEQIVSQVLSLSKERLKNFGDYDFFKNIQVLSPTKKGKLGTKELNIALQEELNPHRDGEIEKQNSGFVYRIRGSRNAN